MEGNLQVGDRIVVLTKCVIKDNSYFLRVMDHNERFYFIKYHLQAPTEFPDPFPEVTSVWWVETRKLLVLECVNTDYKRRMSPSFKVILTK